MAKIKIKIGLAIVLIFLPLFCLASASAPGSIYITQIQITGGKNNTGNDFVEFFNASSSSVNLKGCRLVKRPGNANSDTLVKSWSKDVFIPAKSFYLWANSGFAAIAAKPDVVSSATISDNSGIALRFGPVNTGEILDAVSWGKTDNGFNNVSAANPGAGQSLIRKDLYQFSSDYVIAASSPHNSTMNDLAAAFEASRETDQVIQNNNDNPSASSGPVGNNSQPAAKQPWPAAIAAADEASAPPASPDAGQVAGDNIIAPAAQASEPPYPTQSYAAGASKSNPIKYLILSGVALLALLFIAKKFLFSKGKG